MVLPMLLSGGMGLASSLAKGRKGKGKGMFSGLSQRKRRRRRLTQSQLSELAQIKAILGKTAAANALPFYLGGR